jgi:hypothetical protein
MRFAESRSVYVHDLEKVILPGGAAVRSHGRLFASEAPSGFGRARPPDTEEHAHVFA